MRESQERDWENRKGKTIRRPGGCGGRIFGGQGSLPPESGAEAQVESHKESAIGGLALRHAQRKRKRKEHMMDKLDEELCFNKGMEKTILQCLTCFPPGRNKSKSFRTEKSQKKNTISGDITTPKV